MKAIRTWILVADGARARILENDGPGRGLHAVEGMTFQADHAATHDLVTEREGRSYSSQGPGRSAIEARTDPHRDLKTSFSHHLADVLTRAHHNQAYDRLIIAASPVTLGDLRAAISDKVRATVSAELARDLTKLPNGELPSHFQDLIAL